MTKKGKLKLLGRIKVARQRLRDRAAGDYAVAEAEEQAADEHESRAEAGVDEVKDAALAQLPTARDVRVLLTMVAERDLAMTLLSEAKVATKAAQDESERQRLVLARRARELKVAEKVIDRTRTGLRRDESKAEQRTNDDMASRNGRRDD